MNDNTTPKADLQDVVTHRTAWRRAIVRAKDLTDDDNGTGYYTHELAVFDRTFEVLEKLVSEPVGEAENLRLAIDQALRCTPSVSTGADGFDEPHIVYDCGNPWEILQEALEAAKTSDPGGQDRKYKFENGQFVNRISGEPIPKDEPTFILRARDFHSLAVLKDYLYLIHDDHHKKAVQDRIDEFEKFAMDNPVRMKEPGITGDIELNEEREEDVPITSQLPTP